MESVLFRIGVDANQIATGLNKARASIDSYVKQTAATLKKAAAEQFVTNKAGYDAELKVVKQFETAKTQELLAASRKRDAIKAEALRRSEYLAQRELDAIKGAERAKQIAIERTQNQSAQWRAGLAQQRTAMGVSPATKEVKNTTGVNISNLQRNVAGGSSGVRGGGAGSMIGGQIAADVAAGEHGGTIAKDAGWVAIYGAGSSVGGKIGEKIAKKAEHHLVRGVFKGAARWISAAGGLSAIPVIGAGVAGIIANMQMRKSLNEQDGLYGTTANVKESSAKIAKHLTGQIAQAKEKGFVTAAQAETMQKALATGGESAVRSVQRDLRSSGFKPKSAAEIHAERVRDEELDYTGGRVDLSTLADEARRMTGKAHRRNYTVTPRMRYALKVQDLEEQAKVAYERGDDTNAQKFMKQSVDMRSAAPWLKTMDRNPLRKSEDYLASISAKLDPVKEMAENCNESTE